MEIHRQIDLKTHINTDSFQATHMILTWTFVLPGCKARKAHREL